MNKKINWRRQLTPLEKQTLTELRNKEMIKQGTFYKLEQTFPEESAYTYYGLYRKEQTIQAYIVGYCFDGETLEATIVAPNVGPFFEELVQELEKQAALWGMKEVFLVMDDKQSVGLNYFNRQGIVLCCDKNATRSRSWPSNVTVCAPNDFRKVSLSDYFFRS